MKIWHDCVQKKGSTKLILKVFGISKIIPLLGHERQYSTMPMDRMLACKSKDSGMGSNSTSCFFQISWNPYVLHLHCLIFLVLWNIILLNFWLYKYFKGWSKIINSSLLMFGWVEGQSKFSTKNISSTFHIKKITY